MSRSTPQAASLPIARVLPLRRPGAERPGLRAERPGLRAERPRHRGPCGLEPLAGCHEQAPCVAHVTPRPPADGWAIAAGSGETHDTRTIRLDARALAQMLAGHSPQSAGVTRPYDVPPELLAAMRRIEEGAGAHRLATLHPPGAAGAGERRPRRCAAPAAVADHELPAVGSVVAGKYRVVAHLGRGGSATISLAVFRSAAGVHKLVVIKCPRAPAAHGAALDELLAEARLAARMNHQHVVQVYDVAEHEGLPVIVMEHLDGRSLASVMTAARDLPELDRSLKLGIVAKVLAGLHYAHGLCDLSGRPLHVVHRDVSPHNVVLTCDGQVKLIDFGIALCGAGARPAAARRVAGKLGYMAPEQLHGAADRRADVFAAGVVLWELMTLRRFWARATQAEVMRHLLDRDIPRLASLEADLGAELASICRRALAAEPAERYATAGQMLADVERALRGRPASAADEAIGQIVRRLDAGERLARQRNLQQALSELDAAQRSAPAVAPRASGHATRARQRRRGARPAVGVLAALLALQLGDAALQHRPASPEREATAQLLRPEARRADAIARADGPSARSTSGRPLGNADAPGARRPAERAGDSTPAVAASRPALPPAPRRAGRVGRAGRAGTSSAAPPEHGAAPVAPAAALVTELEPGVDLRGLRQAHGALPPPKGGAR